jgi:hypothetical protein
MLSGYLDPASGSAIISAVAAGAAGAGVAAKTVMAKMRLKKRNVNEVIDPIETVTEADDETVDEPTQ